MPTFSGAHLAPAKRVQLHAQGGPREAECSARSVWAASGKRSLLKAAEQARPPGWPEQASSQRQQSLGSRGRTGPALTQECGQLVLPIPSLQAPPGHVSAHLTALEGSPVLRASAKPAHPAAPAPYPRRGLGLRFSPCAAGTATGQPPGGSPGPAFGAGLALASAGGSHSRASAPLGACCPLRLSSHVLLVTLPAVASDQH